MRRALLLAALTLIATAAAARPAPAAAAHWELVSPELPPGSGEAACAGGAAAGCSTLPLDLGHVGQIAFEAPNRGVLITAGNGSSVRAGVWGYDGIAWKELATVCGASDGRIAWAAPEEFWTVSDGRAGQAASASGLLPPLEDDTLCRFAPNAQTGALEVVRSFATAAFEPNSYQAMTAAGCLSQSDCWFGGGALPEPQPGAFSLHWNGSQMEAVPNTQAASIASIVAFEKSLIEGIGLPSQETPGSEEDSLEILHPFPLYTIGFERAGVVFEGLRPLSAESTPLPEYAVKSFPGALAAFALSAEHSALGEALWAAAGPAASTPAQSRPGVLTMLLDAGGYWRQVLGPPSALTAGATPPSIEGDTVASLAAEPASAAALLALQTPLQTQHPDATDLATVARVEAGGGVEEEELPSAAERAAGIPPQGAAAAIACPAEHDCWLATTRGALFHLTEAGAPALAPDSASAFDGAPITFRPADEGLAQQEGSGEAEGEEPETRAPSVAVSREPTETYRVAVAAYTNARTRLLRGDVLELSFKLAVRSRVGLIARRRGKVVARSATRVLKGGRRSVRVRLDPRRWPTALELAVHPLVQLPTVAAAREVDTITTVAPAGTSGSTSQPDS